MTFWEFIISHLDEIRSQTLEHLVLTLASMSIATLIGVTIGITITKLEKLSTIILSIVGVIQTIPSLALLGFLLPFFGIGTTPAIIALFLYGLLPIVRNTYTGIKEIDSTIIEASVGMGMTKNQLLLYVELPIALPVILAGIRTATVINVGIATLCALIAAGGLGEFIFRGISLNNQQMILAGAIPASILAVALDFFIGYLQKNTRTKKSLIAMLTFGISVITLASLPSTQESSRLIAGFNYEFIEREDGFKGLDAMYDLPIEIKEMEISLMYRALYEGNVDVIDGFSTDGRIKGYGLKSLIDDQSYFPPYYAAPVIHQKTLKKHPELREVLNVLANSISNEQMAELNYLVDNEQKSLEEVANGFLKGMGIYANAEAGKNEDADIIIGSKNFTENFLLAHLFAQLIENKTQLKTKLELGFGGTKLLFDALRTNEIDLYPEYTGTGYLVISKKTSEDVSDFTNPDVIYESVQKDFNEKYQAEWLKPLGFNNTFALMMRRTQADSLGIETVSDLSAYLRKK
ncbi:MAG: ABC transporter permease/substrate-binding protein [Bacteroidota bacterium]